MPLFRLKLKRADVAGCGSRCLHNRPEFSALVCVERAIAGRDRINRRAAGEQGASQRAAIIQDASPAVGEVVADDAAGERPSAKAPARVRTKTNMTILYSFFISKTSPCT